MAAFISPHEPARPRESRTGTGLAGGRSPSWIQQYTNESRLGSFPRQSAFRRLFRRWPSVPTRELERIRSILLHCGEVAHPAANDCLTGPAQALLDLVSAELHRRSGEGHARPPGSDPGAGPGGQAPAGGRGGVL
ncbi:hypothetical protein [Arthrobacter sp. NyZ413]|uniref:hypothetical protein n=1 Tax=Arthrobacter sp. NyZ413 TaxID=3144669 RepID=UPI002B81C51B|nr:hypothetical protein [Arthrobacter sp.]